MQTKQAHVQELDAEEERIWQEEMQAAFAAADAARERFHRDAEVCTWLGSSDFVSIMGTAGTAMRAVR